LALSESEFLARARKIKVLILDVDGVMTNGQIIWDSNRNEIKAFHVRDGHGIKMAERAGLTIAIITGRRSDVVDIRAKELGINEVYQGALEKIPAYREILVKLGLEEDEAAYVGDDIVDIPVMSRVGLSFAVANAEPYVKDAAHCVVTRNGGEGAVREVIDMLLRARGDWESVTEKYFS
jgi:3-deoxy-D-manno-octulosonate 8-phosphate phosphatase (KDO 8-P phosphatase)